MEEKLKKYDFDFTNIRKSQNNSDALIKTQKKRISKDYKRIEKKIEEQSKCENIDQEIKEQQD